jgi:SAM-dependent methyltransferase
MIAPEIAHLIRRAEEVRQELDVRGVRPFVASQYEEVHDVLARLAEDGHGVFLEWGSAVGAITIMAEMLGFEAYGIEIEGDYVEAARRLAEELGSGAEFLEGSFVPRAFRDAEDSESLEIGLPDAYDDHVIEICDADVIYAFPWPDDREVHLEIFERYARPGAVYVSYDVDRFTVVRKRGEDEEEVTLADGFPP